MRIMLAITIVIAGTVLALAITPEEQIIMFGGQSSASGSGGGSGPTPCTNQLVLDYSNSCALIAQGWGQ